MRKGDNTFSGRIVFVSHYRKLCLCFFSLFHKTSGREIISWMRGGYHIFPPKFFGPTLAKTLIGNSSVFQRNSDSEKVVWMREGYIRFFDWLFLSHITEHFVCAYFVVSKNFWPRKNFLDARGISRFSVDAFWSHISENFHWELFSVSKKLSQRKFCMDERRGYHVFSSKFFKSQYRRTSLANLRRFRNFLVWEEKYE